MHQAPCLFSYCPLYLNFSCTRRTSLCLRRVTKLTTVLPTRSAWMTRASPRYQGKAVRQAKNLLIMQATVEQRSATSERLVDSDSLKRIQLSM